ncbi:ATP-binding protein [Catenuloplanes japonicus]|uniref:ATP-binding protein n=1 Tax=Catenuloplanes japonicus TaxID=33876 RepID=UPI000690758F|nr:ATP-binding protein [Catenuloplanes japonicus]
MPTTRHIGPAETSVKAAAARISATARVLVVAGCSALLPIGAPTAVSAAIVAAMLIWQAAFVLARRWPRTVALADVVPLAAACVLLPWLHPAHGHLDLDDWTRPVTSVCVGAAQFYTRPRDGAIYAVVTSSAVWLGSSLASDADWDLGGGQAIMLLWQAALARCLITLLCRGARRVDELTTATAEARRDAELTAARRTDVEEHLAVLHDTVAATLTAAASRGAGSPELRARARADLSRLEPAARTATFADLTTPPEHSTLGVTVVLATACPDPAIPAHAIDALLAARDEAFRNVERHAGTDQAHLRVRVPAPGTVELDIVDVGRGFRPADVPAGPRLGLRLSIEARMRRAGGSARVVSTPGRGTRVELRWPAT